MNSRWPSPALRSRIFLTTKRMCERSFAMTAAAGRRSRSGSPPIPRSQRTPNAEWRSKIERTSNERYTTPRAEVEARITRFYFGIQKGKDGLDQHKS